MNIEKDLLRIHDIQEYFQKKIDNTPEGEKTELIKEDLDIAEESFDLKQKIIEVLASQSSFNLSDPLLIETLAHVQSYELDIAGEIVNTVGKVAFEVINDNIDLENMGLKLSDYLQLKLEKEKNRTYHLASQRILITKAKVPTKLNKFITEAKSNICDENYNAVFSLCRTILEIALKDIGINLGKVEDIINSRQFYKKYPPYELIDSVSQGKLCGRIHVLYDSISPLVHGYKTVGKVKATYTYNETLDVIEEMYNNL